MFDCDTDVRAFHDQKVTLPGSEQEKMRNRRDSNRDRLKLNLEKDEKPKPYEFVSQGSYRMKTMLRDDNSDYDIDDGAYFQKSALVGDRGAEMSSLDARKMVRDAMDDGKFKTPPEVKNNCVRVHYSAGYHLDIPGVPQGSRRRHGRSPFRAGVQLRLAAFRRQGRDGLVRRHPQGHDRPGSVPAPEPASEEAREEPRQLEIAQSEWFSASPWCLRRRRYWSRIAKTWPCIARWKRSRTGSMAIR